MGNVIWRDRHLLRYLYLLIGICGFLFFLYLIIHNFHELSLTLLLIGIGMELFWSYNILVVLSSKLTYITKNGIRIGNTQNDIYTALPIRHKPAFIAWKDITYIQIYKQAVSHGLVSFLASFIRIKSKSGEIYTTYSANPPGFIRCLSQLGKSKLIVETRPHSGLYAQPTKSESKWTKYSLIWMITLILVMLGYRAIFGPVSSEFMGFFWLIVAAPPFIYGILVKQKLIKGKEQEFKIRNRIYSLLWTLALVNMLLIFHFHLFPVSTLAYWLIVIAIYTLLTTIHYRRTIGPLGIIIKDKDALLFAVIQTVILTIFGAALLLATYVPLS